MKTPAYLLMLAASSAADYACPATLSMTDTTALQYGYQIQQLLNQYYQSVPVNTSLFSSLPNAQMQASNGMTLAEEYCHQRRRSRKAGHVGVPSTYGRSRYDSGSLNAANVQLQIARGFKCVRPSHERLQPGSKPVRRIHWSCGLFPDTDLELAQRENRS